MRAAGARVQYGYGLARRSTDEDSGGGPDQMADGGCGCAAAGPDAAGLVAPWIVAVGLGWRRRGLSGAVDPTGGDSR